MHTEVPIYKMEQKVAARILGRIAQNHAEKVICQDCEKVMLFTFARHDGVELCVCGGDFLMLNNN
ncbi:hypothetical protein C9J12_22695 [Photobacterium frigidiphilum]|uniref:Uncharacterized protein n=1 Tax=Photobacterium frigidiphilum TaxID=264736 RepID=A0A2T3J981_9GAMM|nr:hypothetical protein [Photobacterium frigidiphilum]PSU45378.1 hypothetical protein C9J12_22695 [Photobacterium frigidiphilum]